MITNIELSGKILKFSANKLYMFKAQNKMYKIKMFSELN